MTEGSGRLLVLAVGKDSEWGRTMALVATEAQPTPLQDALSVLATAIGKVGLAVGVICFVVLFVRRAPAAGTLRTVSPATCPSIHDSPMWPRCTICQRAHFGPCREFAVPLNATLRFRSADAERKVFEPV